jgi:hypothetical protein
LSWPVVLFQGLVPDSAVILLLGTTIDIFNLMESILDLEVTVVLSTLDVMVKDVLRLLIVAYVTHQWAQAWLHICEYFRRVGPRKSVALINAIFFVGYTVFVGVPLFRSEACLAVEKADIRSKWNMFCRIKLFVLFNLGV